MLWQRIALSRNRGGARNLDGDLLEGRSSEGIACAVRAFSGAIGQWHLLNLYEKVLGQHWPDGLACQRPSGLAERLQRQEVVARKAVSTPAGGQNRGDSLGLTCHNKGTCLKRSGRLELQSSGGPLLVELHRITRGDGLAGSRYHRFVSGLKLPDFRRLQTPRGATY